MKRIYLLLVSILLLGAAKSNAQCQADFQYFTNNLTVQLYDSSFVSPGAGINYTWDLGNGAVTFGQNPTYTYSSAGTYLVCLTISDSLRSCSDSICYNVTVTSNQQPGQCNADFYFSANNLTVQFYDSSWSSPTLPPASSLSYTWNFGNGAFAYTQNPSYTYSSAGTYSVCLTIYDSLSNCSDSTCYNVTVTSNQQPRPCTAAFSYYADTNNVVVFSNFTTPSTGFTYLWDFGDNNTSTATNPTHTYANSNAYLVTLTATSTTPGGPTCTMVDTIYVNYCNAYFTTSVNSNGLVNFYNLSSSSPFSTAYTWHFGDGNTSNQTNPTHTYTTSGTYAVQLDVFDSLNQCFTSYVDSLVITLGTPNSCNANYTVTKDSTVAYGVLIYNTSSNFASHFYTWDFGDGTTGSGRNPSHQYQSFGSYVVCLTITDSILNCTSTFCDTVGMDTLGNLKAGFGLTVQTPLTVGIDEVDVLETLKVFPNPATNTVSVDLKAVSTTVNLRILDISGRVVLENPNNASGNISSFDISGLNNGLYFMLIDNGTSQKVEKFIKSE